jgi:hypothetical protein
MRVEIVGTDLPGRTFGLPGQGDAYKNVHVGVQRKDEVVDLVPGDAARASWSLDIEVVDGPEFRGPYVHGKKGDRFLYLSWGTVGPNGDFEMFRRAKLMLAAIDPDVLSEADRTGSLTGTVALTMRNRTPLCAAVRPPAITWSAE